MIILFISFVYQFWPWRGWRHPDDWLIWLNFLYTLAAFEFTYHCVGILFLLPVIYAAYIFKWKGALVATSVSLLGILPVLFGLWENFNSLLTNLCLLLLPICVILLINIVIELLQKNKKHFAEAEKERRIYLLKTLEIQEGERRRIAQELHDESIQALLATASYAESLESAGEGDITEIKTKAVWIKEAIRRTIEELRRICLDLRPSVLDNLGLVAALRWLIEQANKDCNIHSQIIVNGIKPNLSPQVEVTIFRVVQEALNNIKRHTKTKEAIVNVRFDPEFTRIIIQDDGEGFVVPKKFSLFAVEGKLGLIGMQQRIESLGGTFKVKSGSGEGTLLLIELPS